MLYKRKITHVHFSVRVMTMLLVHQSGQSRKQVTHTGGKTAGRTISRYVIKFFSIGEANPETYKNKIKKQKNSQSHTCITKATITHRTCTTKQYWDRGL